MWPDNRFNVAILFIIVITLLCWCIDAASTASASASVISHDNQPNEHDLKEEQQLYQARSKLRRAIVPLMLGVLLKVSSIVPMKLMIMSLFALLSLLASKFALLLTFATGLLLDKSGPPAKRIIAISDSYIPTHHGSTIGTSEQFSSFGSSADGTGTTGFDAVSLGTNTANTIVDDASIIQSAHKRRRVHNFIH